MEIVHSYHHFISGKGFFLPKKKNSQVTKRKKQIQASVLTSSTEEETPTDVVSTLPVLSAPVGELFFPDYSVQELPDSMTSPVSVTVYHDQPWSMWIKCSISYTDKGSINVNIALLAHIKDLQDQLDKQKPKCF